MINQHQNQKFDIHLWIERASSWQRKFLLLQLYQCESPEKYLERKSKNYNYVKTNPFQL